MSRWIRTWGIHSPSTLPMGRLWRRNTAASESARQRINDAAHPSAVAARDRSARRRGHAERVVTNHGTAIPAA